MLAAVAVVAAQWAATNSQSQRDLLRDAERRFPDRGWPRGERHVIYAWPGTKEEQKGYAEPGGSFSPLVRSFGLSIENGDRIPIAQVKQRFAWVTREPMPVLVTETPIFESHLLCDRPGHWTDLVFRKDGSPVHVALRSAGPAGGPITSLKSVNGLLQINGRWFVRFDPAPTAVRLSEEGPANQGWWRADVTLAAKATAEIIDPQFGHVETLPFPIVRARVKTHDPSMQDALDAEVAHLMMSLVGRETRPVDPLDSPLESVREGSYVVVALARAGQVDVAKQLALSFADHDFFGVFGAEADAPGLALWAVGETAEVAHSRSFDARVWDGILRKVQLIMAMRRAARPMREPHFGSILPRALETPDLDLICDAARGGLIDGRAMVGSVGGQRPILYVNAVSFLGLNEAARIAERRGRADLSAEWQEEAREIREAWGRAQGSSEGKDDQVFMSALWPSHVGDSDAETLRPLFEERWKKRRKPDGGFRERPQRPWFDAAQAHNWLALGNRERALQTLLWFFENQSSAGLFTWWDEGGLEDKFQRWQDVRGWPQPKEVTPSYWTEAEMVLLQLEL